MKKHSLCFVRDLPSKKKIIEIIIFRGRGPCNMYQLIGLEIQTIVIKFIFHFVGIKL